MFLRIPVTIIVHLSASVNILVTAFSHCYEVSFSVVTELSQHATEHNLVIQIEPKLQILFKNVTLCITDDVILGCAGTVHETHYITVILWTNVLYATPNNKINKPLYIKKEIIFK